MTSWLRQLVQTLPDTSVLADKYIHFHTRVIHFFVSFPLTL